MAKLVETKNKLERELLESRESLERLEAREASDQLVEAQEESRKNLARDARFIGVFAAT